MRDNLDLLGRKRLDGVFEMTKETQAKRDELAAERRVLYTGQSALLRTLVHSHTIIGFDAGHAIGRAEGIRAVIEKVKGHYCVECGGGQYYELKEHFAKELSALDHNNGDDN